MLEVTDLFVSLNPPSESWSSENRLPFLSDMSEGDVPTVNHLLGTARNDTLATKPASASISTDAALDNLLSASVEPPNNNSIAPEVLPPGLQYLPMLGTSSLMPGLFQEPFNGIVSQSSHQPTTENAGASNENVWLQPPPSDKGIEQDLFTGVGKPIDTMPQDRVLSPPPLANPSPSAEMEDADLELENLLSINLLLEFQPIASTSVGVDPLTWANLDVTMVVVKKSHDYQNPSFPFQTEFEPSEGLEKPVVFVADESTEIPRDDNALSILQKSIDIAMPKVEEDPVPDTFFDINLVFKENSVNSAHWTITTSCYIALHSAKKVLYPIRCNFARHCVDVTGAKPTYYCSFAVKRTKRNPDALLEHVRDNPFADGGMRETLLHMYPKRETVSHELSSNPSNPGDSNDGDAEMTVPDKATLKECTSHGMRPIGPRGRIMTSEQRRTFASIQKRFAKTPSRERKSALLNSDLYPLFTLGRDECCKEMGTCATWLKHRMRERGIKVWPNRRLIPTTSGLYKLKQQRAAIVRGSQGLEASSPLALPHGDTKAKLMALDTEINKVRELRMEIVRGCCKPAFFAEFQANSRPTILDPDWEI